MGHSKSRFIEDARRVGTGTVRKPHLPGGESVYLFLEFTINVPIAGQKER